MLFIADCTPCTAGYYCAETGLTQPTGECLAGYICELGAYSPTPTDGVTGRPCDRGKYCVNGSSIGRLHDTSIYTCLSCVAGD